MNKVEKKVSHSQTVNSVLIEISKLEFVRMWRNESGAFRTKSGKWLHYGLKGSADLIGIMAGGYFICIEIKVGKDKQSTFQESFQRMIEKHGGYYFIVNKPEQAVPILRRVHDSISRRNAQ